MLCQHRGCGKTYDPSNNSFGQLWHCVTCNQREREKGKETETERSRLTGFLLPLSFFFFSRHYRLLCIPPWRAHLSRRPQGKVLDGHGSGGCGRQSLTTSPSPPPFLLGMVLLPKALHRLYRVSGAPGMAKAVVISRSVRAQACADKKERAPLFCRACLLISACVHCRSFIRDAKRDSIRMRRQRKRAA